MNETVITIVGLVLMATIIALLVYLIKRGIVSTQTVSDCADSINSLWEALDCFPEDSMVAQLYEYARMAVYAVEQLTKTGKIADTSADKKAAAMEYVEHFCEADDVSFDHGIASALVESCVAELPRNQVKQ